METKKPLKNNYKIGQKIEFKNGSKGVVYNVLNLGHTDIRPPYTKNGFPVIKGISFIGYFTIIPDNWDQLYRDEIKESEITKIS